MPAVKKQYRRPANDASPRTSQRMSYVVPRRARWNGRKTAVAAVLAVFCIIFAIVLATNMPVNGDKASVASVETLKNAEPFDIMISASELSPSDQTAQVLTSKASLNQQALPPVLEVTVADDSVVVSDHEDQEDQAEDKAEVAQKFMRQDDIKQALQFQHRAVELAPSNMLYRLDLAIMYDRAEDKDGAVTLYRQVVQAYENHDKTLPTDIAIENVRSRLEYLTSMAQR
jgi:hypothetical protein